MIVDKHLNLNDVEKLVSDTKPKLIFITGKTCTGKSTFARILEKYGYKSLELDFVVRESVVHKFGLQKEGPAFSVYKGKALQEWQDSFEKTTRQKIITKMKTSKLIVDAALASTEVVNRIFSGPLSDFVCIYLHPFDFDFYLKSVESRFKNDLQNKTRSFPIWDLVTEKIISDPTLTKQLIHDYAIESVSQSETRYRNFKSSIKNLVLTGH